MILQAIFILILSILLLIALGCATVIIAAMAFEMVTGQLRDWRETRDSEAYFTHGAAKLEAQRDDLYQRLQFIAAQNGVALNTGYYSPVERDGYQAHFGPLFVDAEETLYRIAYPEIGGDA